MQITREFRFFLRPQAMAGRSANTWSGWNPGLEIAPWMALQLTVSGAVDPVTGYLCNIRDLDGALRESVANWSRRHPSLAGFRYHHLLAWLDADLANRLPAGIRRENLRLVVSPFLHLSRNQESPLMIRWTQQFEFSAAHRLHSTRLDAEENHQLFGKCNNPAGHGHNYVVEVTIESGGNGRPAAPFSPAAFEQQVRETVIDRLDHKHLNHDVAEFAALNPSVENIAAVIFGWLSGAGGGFSLQNVRVYETPKTWADCSAAVPFS